MQDSDQTVAQIVESMLTGAIHRNASDIHIEPGKDGISIRFRVDGTFHKYKEYGPEMRDPIVTRIKILSDQKIDEKRKPQDGKASLIFDDSEYDLRVSTMPTVNGEKIVIRILSQSGNILGLDELGMSDSVMDQYKSALKNTHGLILLTGPTGSGKSTTLFSLLKTFDPDKVNISTLEDPVELRLPGVNQSQIKPDIGYGFAEGLRALVRQDPDIIMVGEIRDIDTVKLAIEAALTGHLVFATLHTNSASSAVERLVNMGADRLLISSVMRLIGSQRLIRRVCPHCSRESKLAESMTSRIKSELGDLTGDQNKWNIIETVGCEKCYDSGYLGRVGLYEAITPSLEISRLINSSATSQEIDDAAQNNGTISLIQDGLMHAIRGETTVTEVLRVIGE